MGPEDPSSTVPPPPTATAHRPRPGQGVALTIPSSSQTQLPPPGAQAAGNDDALMVTGDDLQSHCFGADYNPLDYLYDDPDDYLSDDLDMSDDGGVPLNYFELTDLLSNDIDMDMNAESGGGYDASDEEDSSDQEDQLDVADMLPPLTTTMFTDLPPLVQANLQTTLQALQTINPAVVAQQLELLSQVGGEDDNDDAFQAALPFALSDPNPNTLNPANYGLEQFLQHWAYQSRCLQGLARERRRFPRLRQIQDQLATRTPKVQYQDLEGDKYDLQGIDWEDLGVTRREARERRLLTYNNYANKPGSDRWHPHLPDVILPRGESYFRFRRMDIRRSVHLAHFQLRNVLACTSRSRAFYAGNGVVHQINPVSGTTRAAMMFGDIPVLISTLAAEHGVLLAGGFNGEYCLRNLDTEYVGEKLESHEGTITTHTSGITNHVQIYLPRNSSTPEAAFASNDMGFRVLDLATETFVCETTFRYPVNCTALSPDRRLRVMVGDHCNVLITAAENERNTGGKPDILQELSGHRDFGFACDWADDGYTVATGFQDKAVKIWDARRWSNASGVSTPVCTIRAEMAGVRGLKFSPVGSGKRVLVAAEEADFVNIIDAQTFKTKQTIDMFGEIGGVSFANEGQDLYVLCCDRTRGGLVQLERCGLPAEATHDEVEQLGARDPWWRRAANFDWPENPPPSKREREARTRRRLRAAALEGLEPF